jgi:hypothetical protein
MRFALNALFVISGVTTTWNAMTALGIALIAGGLAVLVGFRSVLFGGGGGGRRRGRRPRRLPGPRAIEAPPPVPALPAGHANPDEGTAAPSASRRAGEGARPGRDVLVADPPGPGDEPVVPQPRGSRRSRRRAERVRQARELEPALGPRAQGRDPGEQGSGGLASIGLADDDPDESPAHLFDQASAQPPGGFAAADREPQGWPTREPAPHAADGDETARGGPAADGPQRHETERPADEARRGAEPDYAEVVRAALARAGGTAPAEARTGAADQQYGDRVQHWVRPQYRDLPEPAGTGAYWTPAPDSYGWPVPVDRLPPASYEPVTGFDLPPQEETTALFGRRDAPEWPPARHAPPFRGRVGPPLDGPIWTAPVLPDQPMPDLTWAGPSTDGDEPLPWRRPAPAPDDGPAVRGRPRPRPRPRGATVYVSRHAADPQQEPPAQ